MSALTDTTVAMPEFGVSGYDTADRFFATRYEQGGRTVYDIDLSLSQVASYLPMPDPDKPTEGNRKIRVAHAESFGEYILWNDSWVAPALLLRAPGGTFEFEVIKEIGGIQWGILSVPRLARTDLHIIDGQHRILGIHIAHDKLAKQLDDARAHLARSKATGAEQGVIRPAEVKIAKLEAIRNRLAAERISIQIVVIDDPVAYKQVFVDIADHALGITNAVKARFDSTKIVNRCLSNVTEHQLLKGHVDMEQDRILGTNKNLLSAKHVTDIIRALEVSLGGRVSNRMESELREGDLERQADDFLDSLIAAFPELAAVAQGSLDVPTLRQSSLLGSTVMLRVLAGVYHELVKKQGKSKGDATAFFAKISSHMGAPVAAEGPWGRTGLFADSAMAPTARRQDLDTLVDTIVGWSTDSPDWLEDPVVSVEPQPAD